MWLFLGPDTYLPRVEVEEVERVKATTVKEGWALKLSATTDTIDKNGVSNFVLLVIYYVVCNPLTTDASRSMVGCPPEGGESSLPYPAIVGCAQLCTLRFVVRLETTSWGTMVVDRTRLLHALR